MAKKAAKIKIQGKKREIALDPKLTKLKKSKKVRK